MHEVQQKIKVLLTPRAIPDLRHGTTVWMCPCCVRFTAEKDHCNAHIESWHLVDLPIAHVQGRFMIELLEVLRGHYIGSGMLQWFYHKSDFIDNWSPANLLHPGWKPGQEADRVLMLAEIDSFWYTRTYG